MSNPIRWGILGAANFARQQMGPAIHEAEGAALVALATSDAAKAGAFSAFSPGLKVFNEYQALLDDPGIDAVYVPLPNHMHVEWTEKALRAGKHVLTEKPVAMTVEEVDRLIALRDETGLLAAEAYMIVHHPQWQRASQLLAEGAIGRLCHVDGAFSFDNRHEAQNIRNRAETGGGSLRDIGVYVFGSTRFVTGEEPEKVVPEVRWQNGIDTFAHVWAEFASFTYSAFTSIRMCPRQEMVFHGEGGVMRLTAPFNANTFGEARIELHGGEPVVTTERFSDTRQYKLQVEAFCRSLRDHTAYPCPLEFSRGTQRMIDMVFDAAGPPDE